MPDAMESFWRDDGICKVCGQKLMDGRLRADNERMREALSWLEDHEPQLVDAAKEKFGIK